MVLGKVKRLVPLIQPEPKADMDGSSKASLRPVMSAAIRWQVTSALSKPKPSPGEHKRKG